MEVRLPGTVICALGWDAGIQYDPNDPLANSIGDALKAGKTVRCGKGDYTVLELNLEQVAELLDDLDNVLDKYNFMWAGDFSNHER